MFIIVNITKSDIRRIYMDASILKYMAFLKTVECESFTKAAELLNYSQSGISRMINDLEQDWGVSLLERNRSGVKLTSDGSKLLPNVKSVREEYRRLQTQVENINGLRSGLIRIGTFSSVATHWLPKIIKAFQRDYPNIDFELLLGDYSEIEHWISEGRVDCAFTRSSSAKDFDITILERDELMAVLPQDSPLAQHESVTLEELCTLPFILLERGGKSEVSELFEQAGLKPQVKFTTWDDYAVMSMVENGLSAAILPKLILRRVQYGICTKKIASAAYRDICFAVRDKRTRSLAVIKFEEYLSERDK